MEPRELEIIEKYKDKDPELKELWEEHLKLEAELEEILNKPYLTTEDEIRKKEIQVKKLRGKDRILEIIKKYSSAA